MDESDDKTMEDTKNLCEWLIAFNESDTLSTTFVGQYKFAITRHAFSMSHETARLNARPCPTTSFRRATGRSSASPKE